MINVSFGIAFLLSWLWNYSPFRPDTIYMVRIFEIGAVVLTAILAYALLKMLKVRRNRNLIASLLIAVGNTAAAVRILFHTYRTFYPPDYLSVEGIMAPNHMDLYIAVLTNYAGIFIIVGLFVALFSNRRLAKKSMEEVDSRD